jgi:hypothetical protein
MSLRVILGAVVVALTVLWLILAPAVSAPAQPPEALPVGTLTAYSPATPPALGTAAFLPTLTQAEPVTIVGHERSIGTR